MMPAFACKWRLLGCVGILIGSLCSSMFLNEALAEGHNLGWVFDRKNPYGGSAILYVSRFGVKMTYPHLYYSVVTVPPAWDVVHYNTKSGKMCVQTLPRYLALKGRNPAIDRRGWKGKSHPVKYAGIPARLFYLSVTEGTMEDTLVGIPRVARTKAKSIVVAKYYATQPLDLPPGVISFLSCFYDVPNVGGIPLGVDEVLSNGTTARPWATLSMRRKEIDSSLFKIPEGLKSCSTQAEVFGGGMQGELDELADDLGLGRKFGK